MLYNFAPDTSSKADTTSKVNLAAAADRETPAPKPVPSPLTSEAPASSRTREQGSANSAAAGQFGFDAYVFDHKNNIKAGATVTSVAGYGEVYGSTATDVGRGVDETVKEDQTFFTPSELKMLLLNFENLTREEQDNLTQYVQRHGMPTASAAPAHGMPASALAHGMPASALAHGMPASAPAQQDSLFSRLVGELSGPVLRIRGFFDPGWKNSDTGFVVTSRITFSESLVTRFFGLKIL
jgi:hypothetical protein